jgi:predicted CXXCH cytochrome family protein
MLLGLTAMACALLAGYPATAAAEPVCYECHDELPAVSNPHDPVDSGECESCHEDHGDDEELRLVEEGSALCYQCHDEMTGASVHPPIEDGECTSCHSPHGSDNSAMLIASAEEICMECHDAPEGASLHAAVDEGCTVCHVPHTSPNSPLLTAPSEELCMECHDAPEGAVVHAAVDEGCTACHVPHSSENSPLLTASQEELCFECHESEGFTHDNTHAAVDDGCTACHNPHASENEKLFVANLTLERLALFEEEQATLCFECHDAGSLTSKGGEDTDFRNGAENLHALHLNGGAKPNKYGFIKKKAGQTCVACHLPHSSRQDKLIRTEFECKGIFCYTMRYVPNSVGGTCIVGCHKPKTYSRDAAKESTAQAPGVRREGTP